MAGTGRPNKVDPRLQNIRSEIQIKDFDAVKSILKELGVDAADSDGRTALISAVIENSPDFVRWLVDNGANVNIQDKIGYSALHFAGQLRLVELSKFLLENGADPNIVDAHGNSPLWTAVFNSKMAEDDKGVVINLLQYGADPGIVNKHGRSAGELYESFHDAEISSLLK